MNCADGESLLRILENDMILRHDSIWPYGLNFRLNVTSFLDLEHLRTSCRRHRWPSARDPDLDDDDDEVGKVQGRLCQRLRRAVSLHETDSIFIIQDQLSFQKVSANLIHWRS